VATLTPYLQEEAAEVVDAVGDRDHPGFREEIGDLLFLVLLLAEAGGDENMGSLEDSSAAVVDKLVSRHPHVFGEGGSLETAGAKRQWEEIKQAEKDNGESDAPASALSARPASLNALTTAYRISEKAGAVGFQWPTVAEAVAKLKEETAELEQALTEGADANTLEDELGDVLYSVANIGRYLGIDPERALRGTTAKFMRRFRHVETRLHQENRTPGTSSLEEMSRLWDEAKGEEAGPEKAS